MVTAQLITTTLTRRASHFFRGRGRKLHSPNWRSNFFRSIHHKLCSHAQNSGNQFLISTWVIFSIPTINIEIILMYIQVKKKNTIPIPRGICQALAVGRTFEPVHHSSCSTPHTSTPFLERQKLGEVRRKQAQEQVQDRYKYDFCLTQDI